MKLCISAIVASCLLATPAFAGNKVRLHGKIQNPISDSISVKYSETWMGYEPKIVAARLASDGSFSLTFPLEKKFTDITITHGNQATEIMPEPGDDLMMTLDANNFDSTLHYSGRGAEAANFVAKHMLFSSYTVQFGAKLQDFCKDAPDTFEQEINGALKKELDFMDANGQGLSVSFKQSWKAIFQYEVYSIMLDYAVYHAMQQQHSYTLRNIPKENYKPVADVPAAFDDALLNVSEYRGYISMYYGEQMNAKAAITGQTQKDDHEELALSYKNLPPKTAEWYGASHIYFKMNSETYAELETRMADYKKRFPHSPYLPWLEAKMALKKKVSPGSMALDFTIHATDGKIMKLSDLKGKVVYLDFWASWCGPCMAQMPSAKKIEEKYKGKDIVFLYVSIDADEASWQKAMDKLKIDGMHTRDGDGGWKGAIATEYGIHSIPAYYLIDKKGRFAIDNTPRPDSADELIKEIDKLLQ